MKLLLDTHVLLWWYAEDRHLKPSEREAIAHADAIVHVSAATVWEIALKRIAGRIQVDEEELARRLETDGFIELPVRGRHARIAAALPRHHGDPFDRMLVAQAQLEGLTLISYDPVFPKYDVSLLPLR